MKKRNLLVGLFSILGMATMSNTVFAQQNLGAACGCPAVAARTTTAAITSVTGAGITWTALPSSAYGTELTAGNITLTCDKIWTLDQKIYIGSGATITIQPGTVIKASVSTTGVAAARALIIERGGKINAPGTEDCPIVFTSVDDAMNGTYGVTNKGKWGGILICGKASNNLTYAANGPFVPGNAGKLAVADGLGVLEGFASSYPQDQFGVALSAPSGAVQATSPTGSYTFQLTSTSEFTALTNAQTAGNKLYFGASATASSGTSGSSTITFSANHPFAVGQKISGTGIASGTTISSVTANTVTLSQALTANVSTSSNAYTVNILPSFVVQGQTVTGTGIPANTTILSIASGIITLSNNVIAASPNTSNAAYTFSADYPNPGATGYFTTISSTTVSGAPVGTAGSNTVSFVGPFYSSTGGFQDDDNSGVMTYVSIRHSGANLLVGSEINGLTLASVGRGTKIEHIEIVSCADDNIEIFGGTVNLKYCTTLFGNDDMYDYDLGWSGKAQFLFGMKAQQAAGTSGSSGVPSGTNPIGYDNDNGFECDSDDNSSNNTPKSNPLIYNATIIGNAKSSGTADNRGLSAINMKEGAQGTIANSIFANFKNGFNLENSLTGRTTQGNSFQYWSTIPQSTPGTLAALEGIGTTPAPSLIVKCNHFVGMTNNLMIGASTIDGTTSVTTPSAATTQFTTTDGNVIVVGNTLPGFNYDFTIDGGSNVVSQKNDVVPNPALATACAAPNDGFFNQVSYRGAFSSTAGDNWLSDWSYSQVLGSTLGVVACPTDLNGDGITNTADFLIFAPAFGTSCN